MRIVSSLYLYKKKGDLYYKNNVDDYFVFKLNLELGSIYCLKKIVL